MDLQEVYEYLDNPPKKLMFLTQNLFTKHPRYS